MKKTILFIALLLTTIATAQDTETINSLVNSNTLDQVKNTSDKIAASAGTKFEYFKTTDRTLRDEKYKVVVYTPSTFTAEDKKEITAEEKQQCLLVVWLVSQDGTYIFKEVNSSSENLQPFWNTTFTASTNEYRVNKDLKYKYVTNENSVSILKSY
jgi:hypothetical protein